VASEGKPRRRLPVVQPPSADEEHAKRPGWHWTVVVALGTLFGWLLLEMVGVGPLLEALAAENGSALATVVHLGALAVPAAASGALAGRLGAQARILHAIGGALGLVALIAVVSFLRVGADPAWAIASALAALTAGASSAAGFLVGRRRPAHEA
jgi:hypothetical protein